MPKPGEGDWQIRDDATNFKAPNLFSVEGKVVVVTGGGSGIGSMMAAGYVANGAKCYVVSRKDCTDIATELTNRGTGKCIALTADVADEKDCIKLVKQLQELEPAGVHVLVNNAGTNWGQPLDKYSMEGWDKVYAVNTRGVFLLSKVFLPLLDAAAASSGTRSVILNIASIDGLSIPSLDTYAYSSGKAAVVHLSKVMAGKFGMSGRKINVNAICPGPFQSRMMRKTIETAGEDRVGSSTCVGRIGSPEDMAGAAIYLSSRAGEYVTGAVVVVDGGSVVLPWGTLSPAQGAKKAKL